MTCERPRFFVLAAVNDTLPASGSIEPGSLAVTMSEIAIFHPQVFNLCAF